MGVARCMAGSVFEEGLKTTGCPSATPARLRIGPSHWLRPRPTLPPLRRGQAATLLAGAAAQNVTSPPPPPVPLLPAAPPLQPESPYRGVCARAHVHRRRPGTNRRRPSRHAAGSPRAPPARLPRPQRLPLTTRRRPRPTCPRAPRCCSPASLGVDQPRGNTPPPYPPPLLPPPDTLPAGQVPSWT